MAIGQGQFDQCDTLADQQSKGNNPIVVFISLVDMEFEWVQP